MRIWTLHPKYLDAKGLVALWRETLLAQKVLQCETLGYRHHPQLVRFRSEQDSLGLVTAYLHSIYKEADDRGYSFNATKITGPPSDRKLTCTQGQLAYEWCHLLNKLQVRDPKRYSEIKGIAEPEAHPLFNIVPGEVEVWEVSSAHRNSTT